MACTEILQIVTYGAPLRVSSPQTETLQASINLLDRGQTATLTVLDTTQFVSQPVDAAPEGLEPSQDHNEYK